MTSFFVVLLHIYMILVVYLYISIGLLLQDFMTAPIISEDVFNMMDKNKDGFVSKGNIKI